MPSAFPDINPRENVWPIIKWDLYENGKEYSRKQDLWKAIKITSIIKVERVKIPNRLSERFMKVTECQWVYIKCIQRYDIVG